MTPPRRPNFYVSQDGYYYLVGEGGWKTREVPLERWSDVAAWLTATTAIAVFASGSGGQDERSRTSEGINAGAGIDVLRHEQRPLPGEPELNVYHYVVGPKETDPNTDSIRYPVYGPYRDGNRTEHWTDFEAAVRSYRLDGGHPDDP